MCDFILGRQRVAYHPWVTVTLTSDIVFRKYFVKISKLVYGCIFGWLYVMYTFGATVTLTYDLVSRIIMSGTKKSKLYEVGIPNSVYGFNL